MDLPAKEWPAAALFSSSESHLWRLSVGHEEGKVTPRASKLFAVICDQPSLFSAIAVVDEANVF